MVSDDRRLGAIIFKILYSSSVFFRIAIDASLIPLRTLDRFLSLFVSIVSSLVENSAKRIIVDLFEFLPQCYTKAFVKYLVQEFTLTKTTVTSAYA